MKSEKQRQRLCMVTAFLLLTGAVLFLDLLLEGGVEGELPYDTREEMQASSPVPYCPKFPLSPGSPSVIKSDCDSRLGNQLSIYSTLWYFSKTYGMHPILHDNQVQRISKVFKEKQLQIKSCNPSKQIIWEPLYEQVGQANYVYKNTTAYLHNKWLDVGRYANALSLYKENIKELKAHFQFKDIYLRSARTALERVASSLRTEDRILYVGVHCRRTDRLTQRWMYARVDGKYYNSAAGIFRRKYNQPGQQVVFVAATDDPKWLKANFRGGDVVFTYDLFGGSMPNPGEDLAILGLCNHTIISVGTFGQWAGLLAGGEVVYPLGIMPSPPAKPSQAKLSEEEFTYTQAGMEGWRPLNISAL